MRQRTPFHRISVDDAQGLLERPDLVILDVRRADAFAQGHADGARHVTMTDLSHVLGTTAKAAPILIYCYRGNASREYAQIFSDFGFSEVYSLDGGYDAWCAKPPGTTHAKPEEALQEWLREQGFTPDDINTTIANSTTPLMKASHQGRCDIIRMIIAVGADINRRNADGNNALWLACVGNHLDAADLLIEAGIDVDNCNDNGATPLMYAASAGKSGVLERLLARGAATTPETLDGFTALDLASTVECLTILRRAVKLAGPKQAASH